MKSEAGEIILTELKLNLDVNSNVNMNIKVVSASQSNGTIVKDSKVVSQAAVNVSTVPATSHALNNDTASSIQTAPMRFAINPSMHILLEQWMTTELTYFKTDLHFRISALRSKLSSL